MMTKGGRAPGEKKVPPFWKSPFGGEIWLGFPIQKGTLQYTPQQDFSQLAHDSSEKTKTPQHSKEFLVKTVGLSGPPEAGKNPCPPCEENLAYKLQGICFIVIVGVSGIGPLLQVPGYS